MSLEADIDQMVERQTRWLVRTNSDVVDRIVSEHMGDVRRKQEAAGLLVPEDTFAKVETDFRQAFDRETATQGTVMAIEVKVLQDRMAEEIAAREELRPLADKVLSSERGLLAALVDEAQYQRALVELRGRTRSQVLALYPTLDDVKDNGVVRVIERVARGGEWARIGVQDDAEPTKDVLVIPRLTEAVRMRRAARVPDSLREAAKQVAGLNSLRFSSAVEHLKSGRGIARRPMPTRVTPR